MRCGLCVPPLVEIVEFDKIKVVSVVAASFSVKRDKRPRSIENSIC